MVFHLVRIFHNIISFLLNNLRKILEVTIGNHTCTVSIGQYFFSDIFIIYMHYKKELLKSILRRVCRIIKQY